MAFPISVTIEEIDEQRKLGWPDFHPEDFCHRCGGRNIPSWFVDSDRFNAAFGPHSSHPYQGIVCPGCFVTAHEEKTGLSTTWKLIPADPFRPLDKGDRRYLYGDNAIVTVLDNQGNKNG